MFLAPGKIELHQREVSKSQPSSRIVDFFIKSRAIKLCSFCLLNKIILASLKYLGTLSWRRKSKTENNMKIHGAAIALCWGRCGAHFPWHRRLCFAVNYEWLLSWIRGFEGPFSNCESSVEAHKLCSFHFQLISRAAVYYALVKKIHLNIQSVPIYIQVLIVVFLCFIR